MSLAARVGIALALLVGAALFVTALLPEGAPTEPPPVQGEAAAPLETGPPAKPGVLDSDESCARCHTEIYEEWMQDRHRQAWVGELYTELSLNHTDPNCFACHAPRPILETGLGSPAETRANFRESGITCLTCHKRGENVVGPIADPADTPECSADCGPVHDPSYPSGARQEATSRFCGVCHNLHGTCDEFAGSAYAREGKTCLSCHMAEVIGPIANGGKPRPRRVHRFPGGHSPETLKEAMSIEARREGGKVIARVVNRGAGHKIPTDARHRAIHLMVTFFDAFDQPVAVETERGLQVEVEMDLIRLFYRLEQREPTQIDPVGTLGKNPWRESSVAIPPLAKGGYAKLSLYYLLRTGWPMHKGTLVQELKVPIDGD